MTIRVLVIDDSRSLVSTLKKALADAEGIAIVDASSTSKKGMDEALSALQFQDVIDLPPEPVFTSGPDFNSAFSRQRPRVLKPKVPNLRPTRRRY